MEFEKPRGKEKPPSLLVNAEEFISVKGFKALGNQLTDKKIKKIVLKEALVYEAPQPEELHDIEVKGEEAITPDSENSQISLDL